jgi:hypothetical protein
VLSVTGNVVPEHERFFEAVCPGRIPGLLHPITTLVHDLLDKTTPDTFGFHAPTVAERS